MARFFVLFKGITGRKREKNGKRPAAQPWRRVTARSGKRAEGEAGVAEAVGAAVAAAVAEAAMTGTIRRLTRLWAVAAAPPLKTSPCSTSWLIKFRLVAPPPLSLRRLAQKDTTTKNRLEKQRASGLAMRLATSPRRRMVIIVGEREAAAAGIETRALRAAVVGSSRLEAEV
jgi:hypothetical protein